MLSAVTGSVLRRILFLWIMLTWPLGLMARTVLIFQPEEDGAKIVAAQLAGIFAEDPSFEVVDAEKVASVLAYYPSSSELPKTQELETWLSRAKEHYLHFHYDEAAAELGTLFGAFEKDPGLLFEEGQKLRDAYVMLALVRWGQKDEEGTSRALKQLFRVDPLYSFDPKQFSPSLITFVKRVRGATQDLATLTVTTHPKVAEVYVNGVYRGVTPLKLDHLPTAKYAVRIAANNYQSFQQEVILNAGETQSIKRELFWIGKQEGTEQNPQNAASQVKEGLRIADLLKVDKVVWVGAAEGIKLQAVDRHYRAGHKPLQAAASEFNPLVKELKKQLKIDLSKNPLKYVHPTGMGDPILLGRNYSRKKKVWMWGAVGTAVVGSVIGGVVAASGGGKSAPPTGSVALSLK